MQNHNGWTLLEAGAIVDVGPVSFRGKSIHGNTWEAATTCGPKGISVLVHQSENPLDFSQDRWLFGSWEDLTANGAMLSNDDGTLIDGLKHAIRNLLPQDVAFDLVPSLR